MRKILLLSDINSAHTKKWAIGIANRGWKVYVFGLHEIKDDWYSEHGIEVTSFGLSLDVARGSRFDKLKYLKAKGVVKNYADKIQADIVHAHYATSYGLLGKKLKHPRFVLSVWGSEVYDFPQRSPIHKLYFKSIVNSADLLCSTSEDMANECRKYVNRKIEVVPFGIDTSYFRSSIPGKTELLTIGTVKSLEEVYGIDRLIKAYAEFRNVSQVESRLWLYGKGSKQSELEKLCEELGILEHVEFKGFVSGQELLEAYESLDIYCALSRRESFGVAIIEAQAMNLPVVVSDAGGLPEVVLDKESGFVIPQGDSSLVAASLVELCDADKREKMGTKGREFVMKSFDFTVNLQRQIDLYETLLISKK